jgi:hypothetical protein
VVGESTIFPGTGGADGTVSGTFLGIGGGRGFSNRGVEEVGGLGGRGGGREEESSGRGISSLGGLAGTEPWEGSLASDPDHLSCTVLCGIEG